MNLGTGTGLSVKQIITAIAQEAGTEVPFILKDRRPSDPASWWQTRQRRETN